MCETLAFITIREKAPGNIITYPVGKNDNMISYGFSKSKIGIGNDSGKIKGKGQLNNWLKKIFNIKKCVKY